MGLPSSPVARTFYRVAKQRFEDARFLLRAGRTTSAVYLAGYGVECMLKALVVSATPAKLRSTTIALFRGRKAHDFQQLITLYIKASGA